jgi:hypothetical protein
MLHLTAECYVERAHVHCVGIAIQKVAAIEDDHLKTNVCFTSDGMDEFDHHEVFQGPILPIVPILIQ